MNLSAIIKPLTYIVFLSLAFLLGFTPLAYAEVSKENKVKAAIIFNLARFSEWPLEISSQNSSPFTMCVMADDVMHDALITLTGKEISGKLVKITPLTSHEANTSKCHILYLSGNAIQDFHLGNLAKSGVLTISDTQEFLSAGGGIAVLRTHKKLVFSINRTAMLRANIKPSSKILSLAKEVR